MLRSKWKRLMINKTIKKLKTRFKGMMMIRMNKRIMHCL